MSRSGFVGYCALAILAAFGLANATNAAEQIPFKGSIAGLVTVTPIDPPLVSVLVEAEGKGTHLGKFTLSIPHAVNRATRTAVGTYEFSAANGDKLFAEFTGESTVTTPGILFIVETATITGGTGRLAGATGTFTAKRLYDTVAGTTAGSFEGSINLSHGSDHDQGD